MPSYFADIDDAFSSCQGCLEEAQDGLADFLSALKTHAANNKPVIINETEAQTGNQVIKIRLPTPPQILQRKGYRVVVDARNALDQAMYAATICIDGKARGTKTHFPFARDPDDFVTLFGRKGQCRDISRSIIPHLKELEPWWQGQNHMGGNDVLRTLGKISGPNKHQVSLAPELNIYAIRYNKAIFDRAIKFLFLPSRIGNTNDFLWAVIAPTGNFHYDGHVSHFIGLRDVPNMRGVPAAVALEAMLSAAVNVIDFVKVRTVEVIG
ncbi:MAG TPA: hypothetical protein VMM59_02720 [Thermohalobaculum sp.]|nr:hypothetical protein [Thermohalobaculum sp.]